MPTATLKKLREASTACVGKLTTISVFFTCLGYGVEKCPNQALNLKSFTEAYEEFVLV